jgi:coenzyme PQQ synthesis protein D (PqqD)
MKLRPDLMLFSLDDHVIAFSEEAQSLVGLNASAAFVFRNLQDAMPESEIAAALVREGLAASEDAEGWVTATLDAFHAHGMLAGSPIPDPRYIYRNVSHETYLTYCNNYENVVGPEYAHSSATCVHWE